MIPISQVVIHKGISIPVVILNYQIRPCLQQVALLQVFRFYFIREYRLHGIVTGVEAVKTLSTHEDALDRLLISFKDAKVRVHTLCPKGLNFSQLVSSQLALLEWSVANHDLLTVSIHTYERAPQLVF